jgi:hypothetical protein
MLGVRRFGGPGPNPQEDAMQRKTTIPAIPDIPPGIDEKISLILGPVKEIIEAREGKRGTLLDAGVTFRDLIALGIISEAEIKEGNFRR